MEINIHNNILLRKNIDSKVNRAIWFVHAFGDSGLSYENMFTSELCNYFNLYAPDFPGYGMSPLKPDHTSLEEAAQFLVEFIETFSSEEYLYLVTHSIGGIIGINAANKLGSRVKGFFNIEGNLTEDDTFFTGQTQQYESGELFKRDFLNQVYEMAKEDMAMKRYFANLCLAHPEALMGWGRSATESSVKSGKEFQELSCRKVYYWGDKSTPKSTQEFIQQNRIPNKQFYDSGHWPMIDQPKSCCNDILEFFI